MNARHLKAKYRRRRFAALLTVLVVVALIATLFVWRPWESGDAVQADEPPATSSAAPTPTPSPEPTSTAQYTPIGGVPDDENEGGTCTPEQIQITPITDAGTYAAGVPVQMSFEIVNLGEAPCSMNVGTTQQVYVVTTGAQVVYQSTDCPLAGVDQVVTLEPGVAQTTVPVPWDRTYSSPETCAIARDQVIGGGASYHLSVSVAGIESATTQQIMLY